MANDTTLKIIAEYIQKNEEALKEFREDIVGLGEDVEKTNEKSEKHTDKTRIMSDAYSGLLTKTSGFRDGLGLLKDGIDLVRQGYEMTIAPAMAYAEAIDELQDVSGATAEEASRMIEVLGDLGVSQDNIIASTKILSKDGLTPSMATIAKLSGEYNKLTTQQEKNDFMLQRLGKNGLAWADVLDKGEDALNRMNAGVDKNLILSQQQVDALKLLSISQDSLNDSWEGAKTQLGVNLAPALKGVTDGFNVYLRGLEIAKEQNIEMTEATDIAGREIWEEQQAMLASADAAAQSETSLEALELKTRAQAEAAKLLSETYTSSLSLIQNVAGELQSYNDKRRRITTLSSDNPLPLPNLRIKRRPRWFIQIAQQNRYTMQ